MYYLCSYSNKMCICMTNQQSLPPVPCRYWRYWRCVFTGVVEEPVESSGSHCGEGEPDKQGDGRAGDGAHHHGKPRQPLPEHREGDGHDGRPDEDTHHLVHPVEAHLRRQRPDEDTHHLVHPVEAHLPRQRPGEDTHHLVHPVEAHLPRQRPGEDTHHLVHPVEAHLRRQRPGEDTHHLVHPVEAHLRRQRPDEDTHHLVHPVEAHLSRQRPAWRRRRRGEPLTVRTRRLSDMQRCVGLVPKAGRRW